MAPLRHGVAQVDLTSWDSQLVPQELKFKLLSDRHDLSNPEVSVDLGAEENGIVPDQFRFITTLIKGWDSFQYKIQVQTDGQVTKFRTYNVGYQNTIDWSCQFHLSQGCSQLHFHFYLRPSLSPQQARQGGGCCNLQL